MKGTFWMMAALFTSACHAGTYSLDSLSNAKAQRQSNGEVLLSYDVRMESLFFSPGLLRTEKGYKVVRCRVGKKCPADVESKANGDHHEAILKNAPAELTLVDDSGKTLTLQN